MESILVVTTPAAATALTTLDRVKLELGISGSENDDLLVAKIDEASADISVRVSPSLRRERVQETFWHSYDRAWRSYRRDSRTGPIILTRYPIVSIISLTVDDVLVDPAEYRHADQSGLIYRIDSSGLPLPWHITKSAVVIYDSGYLLPEEENSNLPPALEGAAIELVSSYWTARGRDPALKGEEVPGVYRADYWVGTVGATGDLPPGVMAKIAPFVRCGGYW